MQQNPALKSRSKSLAAVRSGARPLPGRDRSVDQGKQGMRLRLAHVAPERGDLRASPPELGHQVRPLVGELFARDWDQRNRVRARTNLAAVEGVAAGIRLVDDSLEEAGHRALGRGLVAKPIQLGMLSVALGRAGQHSLCEECLPPARGQRLPIKVPGMHRPDSHEHNVSQWAAVPGPLDRSFCAERNEQDHVD